MSCFTLHARDGHARAGTLHTAHGAVQTPAFMPVGHSGVGQRRDAERTVGERRRDAFRKRVSSLLAPRQGSDRASGVVCTSSCHGMARSSPIAAAFKSFPSRDSRTSTMKGITSLRIWTARATSSRRKPSWRLQEALGSDVAMVLDQLVPAGVDEGVAREAADRTLRWAVRAKNAVRRAGSVNVCDRARARHTKVCADSRRRRSPHSTFPGMRSGACGSGRSDRARA